MNATELKRRMSTAGMSTAELAKLVGVNPRTVRKWRSGASSVPNYLERLWSAVADRHARRYQRQRPGLSRSRAAPAPPTPTRLEGSRG